MYMHQPQSTRDTCCSKSLVCLLTATPLTSKNKPVSMSTVLAKKLTRDHHSTVTLHQKWHDVYPKEQAILLEQAFLLLPQSWNAANQALVSPGLKIEFEGNS